MMFGRDRVRSRYRAGGSSSTPWYASEDFKLSSTSPTLFYDALNQRLAVNGAEAQFTDFQTVTRAGTATCINSSGNIEAVSANQPRYNYNISTLTPEGVLVEQAAENLLFNSKTPYTSWTVNGSTRSASGDTLLGYFSNGAIVASTGADWNNLKTFFDGGWVATTKYAWQCFVKVGTSNKIVVNFFGVQSTSLAGTLGSPLTLTESFAGTATHDSTLSLGGGYYILKGTFTPTITRASCSIGIGPYSTVAGETVVAFGAQVETGYTSTSFIETTAAKVTRAADVITNSTSNTVQFEDWYNSITQGTLLIAYKPIVEGATTNRMALSLDDNTANEAIRLGFFDNASDSLSAEIVDGGATQFDNDIFAYTTGTVQYQSLAYKLNDTYSAANETGGALDTAVTLPTPTLMRIGSSQTNEYLNGSILFIVFWPIRATSLDTISIASETFYNG